MERLAVVIGLLVAGFFAVKALAPDAEIRINISDDDVPRVMAAVDPAAIFTVPETVYAARQLFVDETAVVLEVTPEDRTDIAVAVENAGPLATPTIALEGTTLRISGGLGQSMSCASQGTVHIRGRGAVREAQLPVVRVRVPRSVELESGGANAVRIGPSASAVLTLSGCGDTDIGPVEGLLHVSARGTGDVRATRAGETELELAGSSGVSVQEVDQRLKLTIAGSGSATIAQLTGSADVSVDGSGDVTVNGGSVSDLTVSVAGSGDVTVSAPVTGAAVIRVAGSGEVDLTEEVGTLNATVEGSGSVTALEVQGQQTRLVRGSGEIKVLNEPEAPSPPRPPQVP
jgi:hypothetical protein